MIFSNSPKNGYKDINNIHLGIYISANGCDFMFSFSL